MWTLLFWSQKGGSVGDTVLYLWSAGPTPRDVSRSCAQAQWHSCQTWLCFGRRKNAELCWHISGKTADMARLGDYFIVVGYDQEKAGKFGRRGGSRTAVRGWCSRPGRQSVSWCWCYIAAVSFRLAAANSGNTGNPFLSFSPPSWPKTP